jgi:uncharacterized protein YggE
MIKNRKIIAIALAVVSVLSVGALGIAPAQANEPSRYVTVTGVGSVSVVPDAVRFYPSVTALAAKSADALATASRTASAVRSALRAEGIATKDIKSSNLSVFPEYNYTQDKGSVIVGYRKADTAGKVVESVVNAGNENVQINGIVPFITKGSAAMEEARAAAVADARARAASYAKLLGTSLGRVVYLQENTAPSYNFPMLGVAKAADGATPEIDLGEEELSVSITVRWALN